MAIPVSNRKEYMQSALLQAMCSVNGFSCYSEPDHFGIDGTIKGEFEDTKILYPQISFQLKCTESPDLIRKGSLISYSLDAPTYNRLSCDSVIPKVFILMIVPRDINRWIFTINRATIIRNGMYWTSLTGKEKIAEQDWKTVHIPVANLLTKNSLYAMMLRAARREAI